MLRRATHVYNVAGVVLYVLLGMGSLVGWFSMDAAVGERAAAATLVGGLAALWVVGWLLISHTYWREIVAYARTAA